MIFSENTYVLTRFVFQRALASIYLVAFLIALNQYKGLCGRNGIEPLNLFLGRVKFWDAPSLFWLNQSDLFITILAIIGVGLSIFALIGYSDAFGTITSVVTWFLLWLLYSSFVNVGQTFYSFGWEILILETGFLAIFLGPTQSSPSVVLIWLLRWLLFRLMFGAGMIKIRGDECWLNLTCMKYHYETMPLPGPTSWYFHHLPMWVHKAAVLFNHFVELVVPFFFFGPRNLRHTAGILTIVFQLMIISSGNFSWLNHISIVIAIACFDDAFFAALSGKLVSWAKHMGLASVDATATLATGVPVQITYVFAAIVLLLSYRPIINLVSKTQIMNTSFEPFHIVNTYGAFGSITKMRREIVFEGANTLDGPWYEYQFKGKPGDVSRRPPLVSPYHYKIDWQMWFAAMNSYNYNPWILNLIAKILQNNPTVLDLLDYNPFQEKAPQFLRARLYEYRFTEPGSNDWWDRKLVGEYLPPLSMDDPQFRKVLESQGWLQ